VDTSDGRFGRKENYSIRFDETIGIAIREFRILVFLKIPNPGISCAQILGFSGSKNIIIKKMTLLLSIITKSLLFVGLY